MPHQNDIITIPTIEDLTRRTFISGALASALLIACGGEDEEAPAPEAATRIIDTPLGPVEVPARPQRIVAIDAYQSLQALDELDAPIAAAATLGGGIRTLVSEAARVLPSVGFLELDLEAIIAVNPDLILGGLNEDVAKVYDQLSAIAPTVLVDHDGIDWRETYRSYAEAVGLANRMTDPLARLKERMADLQTSINVTWPNGLRVSVLRITDPNLASVRSYTTLAPHNIGGVLLGELDGATVTADSAATGMQSNVTVPAERLREVDADVILYYLGGGALADADRATLENALLGHPLWPTLEAVKSSRVFRVDADPWFNGGDFGAANLILDDLFEHLT